MGWQEEQHRRNMAESAATRARIEQRNRIAQANMRASQARAAAESEKRHNDFMRAMGAPTHVVRPVNQGGWSSLPHGNSKSSSAAPYTQSTSGASSRPATKWDKAIWLVLGVALVVWFLGHANGAFIVAAVGLGLVLLVALIAMMVALVKGFFRILPKLICIALVCVIVYVIVNHH